MDTTGKSSCSLGAEQAFGYEEVEVAPPQAKEVRVKIVATSVCHTDLYHLYENIHKDGFPVILGHEAAGIVESVGPGVTDFKPEYTVIREFNLAKIHPDAPLDKVCLIGCAICTGYGSAVNVAKVEEGSTCAVFGLGAVGLAAVMGTTANPSTRFMEMTKGGVDFSLECVGNSSVVESALHSTVPAWGVSVIVGYTRIQTFTARPTDLISGRTWKGALFGGFKAKDGVMEMVRRYMDKKLMVDEFITHNMDLGQIMEAVELMKKAGCVRVVLKTCAQ
ncbi:hypothetical protein WMY93_017234 [Mugilogobius chulae]|uniref:Enoyl reductase (ER) domain-containing protein n=1 Tax=Mugilogobius chulae TaxID=88201 RepID=A0AAW0NSK8_9GOBI